MGKKLKTPPLVYFLAQAVLNTKPDMTKYISEFQKKIKKNYPDYREESLMTLQLPIPGVPDVPTPSTIKRWHFLDIKAISGFCLTDSALAFHGVAYPGFDSVRNELLLGLELLHETIGIDYIERVGMRYINIREIKSEEEKDCLHPALRGMTGGGDYIHVGSDNLIKLTGVFSIAVKSLWIHRNGVFFPPELQPVPMSLTFPTGKNMLTLDLDCYAQERTQFNIPALREKLKTLHGHIKQYFSAAIKPALFD